MRRASLPILCFLLVLIGLSTPAFAKRVALVIGNSAYVHATPLRNPKNDAEAVATVLDRLGFTVIKGVDLTRSALEATVRDFALSSRGADVALFFYAGHGLQVHGRNYLVPVDAKLDDEADLDFQTVPIHTVLRNMEHERRTNLVFLDACRNNPLARSLARNMGTRSTSIGRGLARVESGVGTLIAFATQPDNVALDGGGQNSPFTEALLKHIETPNLDIALLMRRVREDVMVVTNDKQVPWSSSSLTGSFAFFEDGTGTPPLAAPQTTKQVAALQKELQRLKGQLDQTAPKSAASPKDLREVAFALQEELARVGCNPGNPDGSWGNKSRSAMQNFNAQTNLALPIGEPTLRAVEAVKARAVLVCPSALTTPSVVPSPSPKQPKVTKKSSSSDFRAQCKAGVLSACQRWCRKGSSKACAAVSRMQ